MSTSNVWHSRLASIAGKRSSPTGTTQISKGMTMNWTTQTFRLKSCALSPGVGVRTGMTVADLRQSFLDNLLCSLGRVPMAATPNEIYTALALTVRDRVHKQGVRTMEARSEQEARVVAYLSAEFLTGPHLANNLLNLGIVEPARGPLSQFGLDLDHVTDQEE